MELKFRVWDNVDRMSTFTLKDLHDGKIQFTDDCPVMQFTGMKDSKNKEICESDIIYWKNGAMSGEAIIKRAAGHFYLSGYPFEENGMLNESFFKKCTKIIGHIYKGNNSTTH